MWNEITRREYDLHSVEPLPKWNQDHVRKYQWWASQGRGWLCKKREVQDGLVVEKILYRARSYG